MAASIVHGRFTLNELDEQAIRDPLARHSPGLSTEQCYLTALLPEEGPPDLDQLAAHGWPAQLHVIGKDILRFHAVYWPAMLMSADLQAAIRAGLTKQPPQLRVP